MNKTYYLSTCDSCKKIIAQLKLPNHFLLQNIKANKITDEQLEEMKTLAGSYEAIFSRRAQKYKSLGLKEKTLTEADYKSLILQEYTFLKRPVFIVDEKIYIGNSPKIVAELKKLFNE